jgi:hypothetical protein
MKKFGCRFSVIFILLVIVTPPLWCAGSIVNAYAALQAYGERLFSAPLPPRTEVLDRHTTYINGGGSSACIGYVSITVATELSEQALRTFYYDTLFAQATGLPLLLVHIDPDPLPDGRLQAVIDSYGGVNGGDYSPFCGFLEQERN